YFKYDADHSRFEVSSMLFDDTGIRWNYVQRPLDGTYFAHAVKLAEANERPSDYVGSNAFGAVAAVKKIERDIYAIFDRKTRDPASPTWKLDKTGQFVGAFYIPVPIEEARRIKDSLQAGVVFSPKEPYASIATQSKDATIQSARETIETVHV